MKIPETKPAPFDVCGFCMDFEDGTLDGEEIIDGFQHLIDSGLAWQLQGHYGRMWTPSDCSAITTRPIHAATSR